MLKKLVVVVTVSAIIGLVGSGISKLYSAMTTNIDTHCLSSSTDVMSANISPKCNMQAEQVSWLAWLQGDSRSGQIHFLDLLELISRYTDKSNRPARNNPGP